jgi:ABC-type Fe3+-hydroxamate transport system substrate-binding protein
VVAAALSFAFATPAGAQPSPGPSPQPSATFAALAVEHTRVAIVPGATVGVNVSGGAGAISARAESDIVEVRLDALSRRVNLIARAPGTTTVTVTDAAGSSVTIDVRVAPAAGIVPSDVSVDLGGFVSPPFATARIEAAIARAAQMQPGTALVVRGLDLPPVLRPDDSIDTQARVRIDGQSGFVDQAGTTSVHVRVETLAQLDPAFLFYSDDPERLDASADGVLYRNSIDTTRSARAYAYHVSDAPDRRLYLALRATGADARVQILGYAAGPTDAFSYAGHVSTLRYLLARGTQESAIATVTRDAPYLVQLGTRALQQGELVAAIFDLRVLEGDPVDVEIVAASGDSDPIDILDLPEREGDGHGRRGEFALGDVPPLPSRRRLRSARRSLQICVPAGGRSAAITASCVASLCKCRTPRTHRHPPIFSRPLPAAPRRRRSGSRAIRDRPKFLA